MKRAAEKIERAATSKTDRRGIEGAAFEIQGCAGKEGRVLGDDHGCARLNRERTGSTARPELSRIERVADREPAVDCPTRPDPRKRNGCCRRRRARDPTVVARDRAAVED